jgi:hypothetical protein
MSNGRSKKKEGKKEGAGRKKEGARSEKRVVLDG